MLALCMTSLLVFIVFLLFIIEINLMIIIIFIIRKWGRKRKKDIGFCHEIDKVFDIE